MIAVFMVGCTGGEPDPEPITRDPAPEDIVCDESAVATVLSVTDSGWSINESLDAHKGVTFAGIITNPSSTEAAVRGTVDVRFLDADGAEVPWAYQGEDFAMTYQLGTLHAGGETAVTGYAHLAEVPDRVEVVPTSACRRSGKSLSAGAVTVDSVTASQGETSCPSTWPCRPRWMRR
jgi:hypothetical protein